MPEIPPYILVPAIGLALLLSFFGMRYVRRSLAKAKQPGGSPEPMIPFTRASAISERVVYATRDAEIEAERLLDKQETLTELEVRKATVDEVRNATKAIVAKNG